VSPPANRNVTTAEIAAATIDATIWLL